MGSHTMILNLNRCVRCRTCYVACKREHNILAHPRDSEHPHEYYRLRYAEWEWGKYPMVKRAFIPMHCMHCEDPICIRFCPVDAIVQRDDGIIKIDKDRCNGCGVCAAVCPYGALYITYDAKADGCDFCADRLDRGLQPRCVEECPAGVRIFGDLDDSKNEVSKLVTSGEAQPLLLKGTVNTKVYFVQSKNEPDWNTLKTNEDFLKTLKERRKDLPPVKGTL